MSEELGKGEMAPPRTDAALEEKEGSHNEQEGSNRGLKPSENQGSAPISGACQNEDPSAGRQYPTQGGPSTATALKIQNGEPCLTEQQPLEGSNQLLEAVSRTHDTVISPADIAINEKDAANRPSITVSASPTPEPNTLCGVSTNHITDETIQATFKRNKKGRYYPLPSQRLRNDLLASVGFLEFANATDFAANVWNTIPVPIYAAVLMGLGGAVALTLVPFAVKDCVRAIRNIRMLRNERLLLLSDRGLGVDEEKGLIRMVLEKGLESEPRLEANRRELGSEIIDRYLMDVFMGFSALMVGIGTLMAIGGANPQVYHASNLLSGYIGNSPSAIWGLLNTLWCAYMFRRVSRHVKAAKKELRSETVKRQLNLRAGSIQHHSFIMGVATLVSGAGGMVTVTRWWGYVMLIPCIIASIYGNYFWRIRIGYERSLGRQCLGRQGQLEMARDELVTELEWVDSMRSLLADNQSIQLDELVADPKSTSSIIDFLRRCNLFEDFCGRLLREAPFASLVGSTPDGVVTISLATVNSVSDQFEPLILAAAQASFRETGQRMLKYKERYLLELLGASLYGRGKRTNSIEMRHRSLSYG